VDIKLDYQKDSGNYVRVIIYEQPSKTAERLDRDMRPRPHPYSSDELDVDSTKWLG